jgi:Na+-translocating ferredoxin:NAD+ oxidoreductase RnfC subunit
MSDPVLDLIRERLRRGCAVDASGRPLHAHGAAPVVIGRVCDDQPLVATQASVAAFAPDRVVRGLAGAGILCGAERLILAVDAGAQSLLARLGERARETRIELRAIPPSAPLDDDSLLCDLAHGLGAAGPGAAGIDRALCLDTVSLVDLALALEGQAPRRRTLTVAGHLRGPAVLEAALGTSFADLVEACGGSPDPGWVGFENGVLGGRRVQPGESVELTTRALLVLPHDHGLLGRATTPILDELGRAASACARCRVCSELCPVRLNGGPLDPQRLLQVWAARGEGLSLGERDDGLLLGALACSGCGVCSAACPAALDPARLVRELAGRLEAQGLALERPPLCPLPDRAGRRVSVSRLVDALGLRPFEQPLARRSGHLIPERVRYAVRSRGGGARVPVVSPGEAVQVGETLALAAAGTAEVDCCSAVSGTVLRVDPDDGVLIATR